MPGERFVALGLASARAVWFREVARWATSSALPLEFIKCISAEELRARLTSGRAFSAVLVDAATSALDRDLVELARANGCAVLVVDDGRAPRDWDALRVSAVLPQNLSRTALLDALTAHAAPIQRGDDPAVGPRSDVEASASPGALIAVTGSGGAGASTVAMAIAQHLGGDTSQGGRVLLADFALDADLAMLHDAGDVVPGVQELVEAHRLGDPSTHALYALTFAVADRDYDLLLGLRRHRDWTAIRPRAFQAALKNLRRAYRAVVADVSPDLEGEDQCGSIDIEERNVMTRTTIASADAVVIVGLPGPKGLLRLVRLASALVDYGISPSRVVPVMNRAPRKPRARAELTRGFTSLTGPFPTDDAFTPVVHIGERRHLDDLLRDCARLPASLASAVGGAVQVVIDRDLAVSARIKSKPLREPVRVAPGSLGSFLDDEEAL